MFNRTPLRITFRLIDSRVYKYIKLNIYPINHTFQIAPTGNGAKSTVFFFFFVMISTVNLLPENRCLPSHLAILLYKIQREERVLI